MDEIRELLEKASVENLATQDVINNLIRVIDLLIIEIENLKQ